MTEGKLVGLERRFLWSWRQDSDDNLVTAKSSGDHPHLTLCYIEHYPHLLMTETVVGLRRDRLTMKLWLSDFYLYEPIIDFFCCCKVNQDPIPG